MSVILLARFTGRPYQSPARERAAPRATPARRLGKPCALDLGGLDQRDCGIEQGIVVGRDQHRRVAQHLHKAHGRIGELARQLVESPDDRGQLFRRQPLAELREADQIREANRYLLGSGEAPGLELRPADRVVSELFTDVEPQDVLERHDQKRQECGRRLRVAPRRLELGVPLSQHGLADNGPIRGGELGGREAHDARRVVDLVRGEPRVEDAAQPAGGVEIVLGVGRLVGIGSGQAESLTLAPQASRARPRQARRSPWPYSAARHPRAGARRGAAPAGPPRPLGEAPPTRLHRRPAP